MKNDRADALLAAMTLSLTMFFFIPISIYLLNRESILANDFHMTFFWLGLSGGVFMATSVPLLLLKKKGRLGGIAVVTFLSTALWAQANLFNWDYGLLNGEALPWEPVDWRSIIDIAALGLILAFVMFWGVYKNRSLRSLCVVLLFIQCGNLALVISTARTQGLEIDRRVEKIGATPAQKFNFSEKKNIIVLVLDAYQSDLFLESVEVDSALQKALNGFTYYPDTVGAYPGTLLTIPVLLTGMFYTNESPLYAYLRDSYAKYAATKLLSDHGYNIGVHPYYAVAPYKYTCDSAFMEAGIDVADNVGFRQTAALSLFRIAPHLLKNCVFRHILVAGPEIEDRDQFLFEMELFATADLSEPALRWYHLKGIHPPWKVDGISIPRAGRDNAMLITKQVNDLIIRFLDRLKGLGVYDNSAIIILGDHGLGGVAHRDNTLASISEIVSQAHCFEGLTSNLHERTFSNWRWEKALPVFLVKPFGASHSFAVSCLPVSLADIYPTILDFAGIQPAQDLPGKSILQIQPDTPRLRTYYLYYAATRHVRPQGYFSPLYEFKITGFAWHKHSRVYTGNRYSAGILKRQPLDNIELGVSLRFGSAGTGIQYLNDAWRKEETYHVTTGEMAVFNLLFDNVESDLELLMEVSPDSLSKAIGLPRIQLHAGNKLLGSYEVAEETTIKTIIPTTAIADGMLTLRMEMIEPASPGVKDATDHNRTHAIRLFSIQFNTDQKEAGV